MNFGVDWSGAPTHENLEDLNRLSRQLDRTTVREGCRPGSHGIDIVVVESDVSVILTALWREHDKPAALTVVAEDWDACYSRFHNILMEIFKVPEDKRGT